MKDKRYVIGVDFGSDSARAIIVDLISARTIAEASKSYPRWKQRKYCDSDRFKYRQHPKDYLEVLEDILKKVLSELTDDQRCLVAGIAIDTTGSTVCPVDIEGTPLSLLPEFAEEPDAMFHLWKDHTAVEEAKEINKLLSSEEQNYTKYQGTYSAEWFWAKILHTSRTNQRVKEHAYTWVEHCDWIAGILAGKTAPNEIVHCACAAGHKALWNSEFHGLPDRSCLEKIDPYLGIIHDRYSQKPKVAGEKIGSLCPEWAQKLQLPETVSIAVGTFDAHAGAVGVGISEHTLVKVVGTSTVDMLIVSRTDAEGKNLNNFCGMAEDSIIPGYWGCESGQSAFGDTYDWYKRIIMWPLETMDIPEEIIPKKERKRLRNYLDKILIRSLEKYVTEDESSEVTALDWLNGRRYPYLNETVKGAMVGISLGTTAPDIYQALAKATIFGSKQIYDSLVEAGIQISRVVCVGGVASKSKYIMQMMADVLGIPIMVSSETQSCARGACIFAAVGAGVYPSIQDAQKDLCASYQPDFFPREEMHNKYMKEYRKYINLGKYIEKEGEM